jgi:CRP-like cAMP-binding protein
MGLDIFEKYERRTVKAGTIIFQENSPGDVMYIIISGCIAISKRVMENVDKTLNILEAGEYFGEMSLFLRGDRTATAKAVEDSVLVELTLDKFKQLLQEHLEVGMNLLFQLAQRLEKVTEEAILLALELELSKRKPSLYPPTGLPTEQMIIATGSFAAKDRQEVLRLRKELHWNRDTHVIASLIKPGQLHNALIYIIQTDKIREIMKLTSCFKDLVQWDISLAVPAESELLDMEEHD